MRKIQGYLTGLLIFLTAALPAYAIDLSENFNDEKLNTSFWESSSSNGASVRESGGMLDMTAQGDTRFSNTNIISKCQLIGNFDVQVDFDLVNFNRYWSIATLSVVSPELKDKANIYVSVSSDNNKHYESTYVINGKLFTPAGYATPKLWNPSLNQLKTGKLRLVRNGSVITSYYWQNETWHPLISKYVFAGPGRVLLEVGNNGLYGSGDNPYVNVLWDNLLVKADDIIGCEEPPIEVTIDIKPGNFPNSINVKSNGVTPVALLTTDNFDATTVDPETLRFGRTGIEAPIKHFAYEDVDMDGDIDIILHFSTMETDLICHDEFAYLSGKTLDESKIAGTDLVKIVGCK